MRRFVKACLGSPPVTRTLSRRARGRLVVLMYHDLREDDDFGNWMRVPASVFDRQLGMLRRLGPFVGPEALDAPEALDPRRPSFLITFDDGYVNNHRLALPLLEKHEAPALFFVSTRHMAERRTFWTDVVVTAVQAGRLEALDLHEFGLGVFGFRREDGPGRWDDIQALLSALKTVGNADHPVVAEILGRLCEDHPALLDEHLPRFRPLAPDEVRGMAAGGLCRFGAHGHDHDILTYLDDEALETNLREPKRILEDLVGAPVVDLAYPNGDHDPRVHARAAAAGYVRAYTVQPGIVPPGAAPLALPRIGIGGYDELLTTRYLLNRHFAGA